jgi:hypothetical protein
MLFLPRMFMAVVHAIEETSAIPARLMVFMLAVHT